MKITNSTKWDTRAMRQIFSACVRMVNKIEKPRYKKSIYLTIKNKSWGSVAGRATLGGTHMTLTVGVGVNFYTLQHKIILAQVFVHEYYHLLGYRHQDRKNYVNDFTRNFDYVGLVQDTAVDVKTEKPKPVIDHQLKRYEQVLVMVKKWQAKSKAAKNKLSIYLAKQRRYERVLVAAGKINLEK